MSVAQHTAFTTITTSNAITLADAGAVTGKAAIVTYNLANGTNTFTASSTAVSNSVTGGSGADTFNFGQLTDGTTQSLVTDTIIGGTGTDTLNITGNIALTATLTNVTTIENIVLANTSTAVSLTLANGNVAAAASMTIDGSSMTTAAAILTVDGALEADGSLNIIGGNAADILTGGGIADTITGGNGADSITGGAGADTISLTEAIAAVDEVVVTTGITADTITGFTAGAGGDQLDFLLTALNAAGGVTAAETDTIAFFGTAGAAITDATAGATNAVRTIDNDTSTHATITGATVILLHGGATTFANVGAAVDAFEAAGGFTITHQSNVADDDTFLFAYENSTTGFVHIAAASFEAADDNNAAAAVIADGALKGTDLVILSGVVDVTTLTAANFDFI
jgi:hypothetical protein